MSLLDRLYKPVSFKRLLWPFIISVSIPLMFSGCSKRDNSDSSSPTGHSGRDNVDNVGITDNDGEVTLDIEGNLFDITIKNNSGFPLEDISVKGAYFGNNIFCFLSEDFNHNYFSDVVYINLGNYSVCSEESFSINRILNDIRGRDYEKEIVDDNEPYIYDLSHNSRLEFLGTVALDDLYDFYVENDAIFNNISLLEFSVDLTSRPELAFALEAANFRETFIEEINNYSDMINDFTSFFGVTFEKEALYLDVYKNNLGVLVHQISLTNYITLRGTVFDNNSRNLSDVSIEILTGPTSGSTSTTGNGKYFLKFLKQGDYTLDVSLSGFESSRKSMSLRFLGYEQPLCWIMDICLTPTSSQGTVTLQPGSEGKDAYVSKNNHSTNYGSSQDLWIKYNFMGEGDICRAYLQFNISSIPNNAEISFAELSLHGKGYEDYGSNQNLTLSVEEAYDFWSEQNVCWDNQSRRDSYIYDTDVPITGSHNEWIYFNITSLVQSWLDGSNNGLAIVFDQESGKKGANFHSSDYSNSNFRPKLRIIYTN